MLLEQLIQDIAILQLHGEVRREVRGVAYHSGQVSEGSLFVAIEGTQSDGHEYVRQAIDQGANTVVVDKPSLGLLTRGLPLLRYQVGFMVFPLTASP